MSNEENGAGGGGEGVQPPPPADQKSELWSPLEAQIVAVLSSSGVVLDPERALTRDKIVDTVRQLVSAYKGEIAKHAADDQLIKQLAAKLAAKL